MNRTQQDLEGRIKLIQGIFSRHRNLIGGLFWLFSSQIVAQQLPPTIHLETLDDPGLSQVTVTSIVQDSVGFLWIATRDGLNRFDGTNFKTYYHSRNDSTSIQGNVLYDLKYNSHKIWIACSNGISSFDEFENRFTNYPIYKFEAIPREATVRRLEVVGEKVLVGTTDGLYTLDTKSGKYYLEHKYLILNGKRIKTLLHDSEGNNWIGTADGIYKDNNETIRHIALGSVNHLYEDPSSGNIYASTQEGLYKSKAGGDFSKVVIPLAPEREIYHVIRSHEGNLWLASAGGCVLVLDKDDVLISQSYPDRPFSEKLVMALMQERQGVVWMGVSGNGLMRFSHYSDRFSKIVSNATDKNHLTDGKVRAVYSEDDEVIYVANIGGLDILNLRNGEKLNINLYPKLSYEEDGFFGAQTFFKDRYDSLWVGTFNGIFKFKVPITNSRQRHQILAWPANSPNQIFTIKQFDENHVIVGTTKGLFLVNIITNETRPFEKEKYELPGGFVDNLNIALLENKVWVGTANGILLFDRAGSLLEAITTSSTNFSNELIKCFLVDSKQRVWVGTWGGGLNLLNSNDKTFTPYSTEQGLANGVVYGIIEDNSGYLWVSTNRGISLFDPEKAQFTNFDKSDGLSDKEFNTNAYWKSVQGKIYFGGVEGVTYFDPQDIFVSIPTPKTVLTNVYVNDKLVALSQNTSQKQRLNGVEKLMLEWSERNFQVEVAGISYYSSHIHFQYWLENFDKGWINVKSGNNVNFTNIPSGEYILRVRSSIDGRTWEESPLSLSVVIETPFWLKWEVQTVAVGAFLLLLVGGYRWKEYENRKKTKLLESIIDARTKEIQQKTEEISSQNETLKVKTEELAQRNEELQKIKSRLEDKVDFTAKAGNLGLWTWVAKSNRLQISKEGLVQLGYEKNDANDWTNHLRSILHPEDQALFSIFELSKVPPFPVFRFEFRVRHKDGTYRWLLTQGTHEFDAAGHLVQINGINLDISEKKNAEDALRKSEERLSQAISVSQIGIFDHDHVSNTIYWSAEQRNIYGYRQEDEVTLENYSKHIHPDDRVRVSEALKQAQEPSGNGLLDIEYRIVNTKGEVRWLSTRSRSIFESFGDAKRIVRTVGAVVDITERKKAEQALMRAKELAEEANRAKTEFLANMSHEIRTPMNAILGFSEVLLGATRDKTSQGYLNTIISSGKSLLSLLNDLLDLSRIESGAMELRPAPLQLIDVLGDVREMFRNHLRKKKLNFDIVASDDFPQVLLLDEVRIRQVIVNLVGNAVKFTEEGKITLEVVASPGKKESHYAIRIKVHDTGVGVSKSDQKIIFESFRQAKDVSVRHFGGTGLGLSIVKRLVNLMGGEVSVESELGKGSTFDVLLPEVEQGYSIPLEKKYKPEFYKPHFKNVSLLVVDDIFINIELIEAFLDQHGITVIKASNGKEAVTKAVEILPKAILMDFRMPQLDGREAAAILKTIQETKNIPIIAFTASTQGLELERLGIVFDGFLAKPVAKSSLLEELKKHLPFELIGSEEIDYRGQEKSVAITDEEFESLQALVPSLLEIFAGKAQRLTEAMDLNEMEQFITDLKGFSANNNLSFFAEYADALDELYDMFDIESIEHRLRDLIKILNTIARESHGTLNKP